MNHLPPRHQLAWRSRWDPGADAVPPYLADGVASGTRRILIGNMPNAADELSALKNGLLQQQPKIESKFFYDRAGCALFSDICRLPEYYLTRTEAAIFDLHRHQIAACLPSRSQWIDLGCGDGAKSLAWIDTIEARRFVGVDIAHGCLSGTVDAMTMNFPWLECLGIVTDLAKPLRLHAILAERSDWPPIFFYPGSSLGNFTPADATSLLSSIRRHLEYDGGLLIGIDLVKDAALLEAAYNDTQGVTAAFNRNILRAANRLLGADFDQNLFEHCAFFNAKHSRVEMHLRARAAQTVHIDGEARHFAKNETILTEYSHKYAVDDFAALLGAAGFGRHRFWTDERGWFAVFLAQP